MHPRKTVADVALEVLTAMGEEEQEACIHCGNVWYSIHYRDGVCHACQQKNLPGRAELARRRRHLKVMYGLGILALLFLILRGIFAW